MPDHPSLDRRTTAPPPSPPPFTCIRRDGPRSTSVHPVGELDLAGLREFREMLREAQSGSTSVSVDLRGLSFIDCAGLGAILEAVDFAQRGGGSLTLVRGSGQVQRIFEMTGVLDQVEPVAAEPVIRVVDARAAHVSV